MLIKCKFNANLMFILFHGFAEVALDLKRNQKELKANR